MAQVHDKDHQHNQPPKKTTSSHTGSQKSAASAGTQTAGDSKRATPMIVEKVNKIPVVNMAISMGFSQYDKLKASNVTVGDVMTRAEGWALYLWEKVQPIVDKLQEPIGQADKLACNTFDFVEDKLTTMKIPQTVEGLVTKYKGVLTGDKSKAAGEQPTSN